MGKTAVTGFESRGDTYAMKPEKLKIITDKADPFYDPRAEITFDHPKMQYVIESLMATANDPKYRGCGNYSPIPIRKNGKDSNGDDVYEALDGRQRIKAAREINRRYREMGKEEILLRCIYMPVVEEKDFFTVMATQNECRIETPPSMLAIQIDNFIESKKGEGEESMAAAWKDAERAFARPEHELRALKRIARLCEEVHKAVDVGRISVAAAGKFEDMTIQAQRTAIRELIESKERITARKAEQKARTLPCADGGIPAPKKPKMRSRREIESFLNTERDPNDLRDYDEGYMDALKWVLCMEKGEICNG